MALDQALDQGVQVCTRLLEPLPPGQPLRPYLVLLRSDQPAKAIGFRFTGRDNCAQERMRYQMADAVLGCRPDFAVSIQLARNSIRMVRRDSLLLSVCDTHHHARSAVVDYTRLPLKAMVRRIVRFSRIWGEPAESLKAAMYLAALGAAPLGDQRIEQIIAGC